MSLLHVAGDMKWGWPSGDENQFEVGPGIVFVCGDFQVQYHFCVFVS